MPSLGVLRPPRFWSSRASPVAQALRPLGWAYGRFVATRMGARASTRARVCVVCVGNFVTGGAGKTPMAIALANMAQDLGLRPVFLTRGYGANLKGPVWVDRITHTADDAGDEALLLARTAPVIVARHRAEGAALVNPDRYDLIIMDDGLQNPSLAKTLTLAVVDSAYGIGNGFCLPAGPLRAPLSKQMPYVDLVVGINGPPGRSVELAAHQHHIPVIGATMVQDIPTNLLDSPAIAFAGIGRPRKFFDQLTQNGLDLVRTFAFADHHIFSHADARTLLDAAAAHCAKLVTTQKDAMRLIHHSNGALGELARAAHGIPVSLNFATPAILLERLTKACKNTDGP